MNSSALALYSSYTSSQISFLIDMTHLAGDVVHDEEGDGPLVVPGDLAGVGVAAPELSPKSLGLVNIGLVSGGLTSSS